MSDLPKGWAWAALGDLLSNIETGKSFKCEERPPTSDEVGVVKVSAVTWGCYDEDASKTCQDPERVNPALFVEQGDFLFSRANTIELVGACVIAERVSRSVMLSDKILRFHFERSAHKSWVLQLLRSKEGRRQIEALSSGNQESMRNIGQDSIRQIQVPVPPSAEQTRIVAKLEELLSDLDAGVAELKAAQKKLVQYRQSLLKAAVEGALTAEWRTQHQPLETGAQLLQRILQERRARWEARQLAKFKEQGKSPPKDWQKKYPEPVQPDTTGLPELPHGWIWASLDALIDDGPQNGLYLPASQYGKGIPILRIDDYQIGWHRPRADLNLVDADEITAEAYALNVGDIVINRVNSMTHLGKSLNITPTLDGSLFESNMMRLRLSERMNVDYVSFYLGSHAGRSRLICDAKWAVNQASINQQDVKKTPVPVSSQAEQERISEVLLRQHEGMDLQAKAIEVSLQQATAQRQNILRAAFSGQLVPQDPADEPASVLLERIRAERAAQGAQPRKRRAAKETS